MKRIAPILLLIALGACVARSTAPEPDPEDGHTFTYTPPAGAPAITSITVPGSFNGWSTSAVPMTRQPNGSWRARVQLAEGRHEYKFHINGSWPADMCDDRTWGDPAKDYWIDHNAIGCVPDGHNGQNAVVDIVPAGGRTGLGFLHEPQNAAHVSVAEGRLSVRFRVNQQQVQQAQLIVGGDTVPMHLQLNYRLTDVWRGTLPENVTSYTIAVQTASEGARQFGPFTVPTTLFRAVPWVGEAVGYQIFPERFWNGDPFNDSLTITTDEYPFIHESLRGASPLLTQQWDGPVTDQHCCHQYFGGDLQGIIDRLDHLQALGVTLIYMNPIFHAGSAHGYDGHDYLRVAPEFGDSTTLRALLTAARQRGIRVMWDFVPNHVGVGHWAFQDAVSKGTSSPYWSWFTFKVPASQIQVGNGNHYEGWWGLGSLPKLNTRISAVQEHLMQVVRHWTEFGFDGIRVDVPGEIANRVEFFRAFRQTAKQLNPDAYLVGEIWQRAPEWLQGDQFDALMNYAIGQDVIERYARGDLTGSAAAHAMAQLYGEYPEASVAMQFNLISSHDNARLLTKLGGGPLGATPGAQALARHRLASAMLYSLPGMPVTFQGDECAFLGAGGGREENRYPMQWDRCDQAMVMHYQQLAATRSATAALTSPVIRFHRAEGALLSYFRGEPGATEVLAVFNAGTGSATFTLPGGSWIDVTTGEALNGSASLAPHGWRFLRRASA